MEMFWIYWIVFTYLSKSLEAAKFFIPKLQLPRNHDPLLNNNDVSNPDFSRRCVSKYWFGDPLTNTTHGICNYFVCNHGIYTKTACPSGLSVLGSLKNRWHKKRMGLEEMPCKKPHQKCRTRIAAGSGNETDGREGVLSRKPIKVCGIDLVWAVDISCSIDPDSKKKVRNFIVKATNKIPVRAQYSQVGVLTFSEKVYHVAYMNEFKRQGKLMDQIKKMKLEPDDCGTVTNEALYEARTKYFSEELGARKKRKKVLIVLSDGFTYPRSNIEDTFKQAKDVHKAGIEAFVLGMPNAKLVEQGADNIFAGQEEWEAIATKPENIFKLTSFDDLGKIITRIIKEACLTIGIPGSN
ncbi:unnamed protein product [Owenia fusiformis]|uniref:Uncharacterized protein n=1 Tax=Owenia fusiformis TaxID=6347 RepID=A0A8J1U2A3_OWEFU|nr:unnamed protein product [Owenia fusiformis]